MSINVVMSATSINMSADALGEEQTVTVTRDQVWRYMPSQAGGPEWAWLVDEAIAYYAEWAQTRRTDSGRDDLPSEFGEDKTPTYHADQARRFTDLELWNVPDVEDMVQDIGAADTLRDSGIVGLMGFYVTFAAVLTMRAVLTAVEMSEA